MIKNGLWTINLIQMISGLYILAGDYHMHSLRVRSAHLKECARQYGKPHEIYFKRCLGTIGMLCFKHGQFGVGAVALRAEECFQRARNEQNNTRCPSGDASIDAPRSACENAK